MSWFNTSGFATLAKSALSQAQKTIDKALDIKDEHVGNDANKAKPAPSIPDDPDSFFATYGLGEETKIPNAKPITPSTISERSKAKANMTDVTSSIWGSFAGSFFETPKDRSETSDENQQEQESLTDKKTTIALQPQKRTSAKQQASAIASLSDDPYVEMSGNADFPPDFFHVSTRSTLETSEGFQSVPVFAATSRSGDGDSVATVVDQQCSDTSLDQDWQPAEVPEVITKDDTQVTDLQEVLNMPVTKDDFQVTNVIEDTNFSLPFMESSQTEAMSQLGAGAYEKLDSSQISLESLSTNSLNISNVPESSGTRVYKRYSEDGSDPDWSETALDTSGVLKQSLTEVKGLQKLSSDNLGEKDGMLIIQIGSSPDSSASKDLLQSDLKTAMSLISISSGSTTGESSSTLDESLGTLSIRSEKGFSSTTATPELFSDSTESFVPLGMSSSSCEDMIDSEQQCQTQQLKAVTIGIESKLKSQCEDTTSGASEGTDPKTDLDSTLTEDVEEATETAVSIQKKDNEMAESAVLSDLAVIQDSNLEDSNNKLSTISVSYMIKDAMTESDGMYGGSGPPLGRAHSPNSTTSSTSSNAERSDPVKMTESEQNSGHTSGDELETTTSSDIEIISSPSMGGESGCERSGSISPIKQSSARRSKSDGDPRTCSMRYHGSLIHRSYSPASDTSSTKDSQVGHLVVTSRPDLTFTSALGEKDKCQRNKSEMLLDQHDGHQNQLGALKRKVAELHNILEARERKVLDVSHENAELREMVSSLKSQLKKAGEVHAADTRDVSTLTKELTERLSHAEKNLQQALKEKESLKRDLQQATVEIASRVSAAQVEEIRKEKDTQIAELMQEGESLSKKILQYSNNVKKLRAKEKDNETHIKQQREKIEDQSRELERVRKALDAKEEVEKNQIELIRQLTNTVHKQEQEIEAFKSELEDAQEKQRSMKVAMESAYKEMAELHRKNVEQDSKVQEATLSAEMNAKEELRLSLEKLQRESKLQQEGLIFQIEELQLTIARNEQQASLREDGLRQDITHLQRRLQEAESRNDELNQNVSAATRPLLRQIDNLQATLNVQTSSWARIEHSLTERLHDTQNQLVHTSEKERAIAEKYAELGTKVASLEAQISSMRQEKTRLQAQHEAANVELQLMTDSKERESASLKRLKQTFMEEITGLKREKDMLSNQLEIEKTALEAERRKTSILHDQVKEKEQKLTQMSSFEGSHCGTPSPRGSVSMRGSFNEHLQSSWYQDDVSESGGAMFPPIANSRMNVYESLRAGSMATLLDSLQSQLKLRDGDISQLQNDIAQLERVKESMTVELVKLSARNEELEAKLTSLRDQLINFQDTEQRYNALLQMYGEKIEEAEELKLDLQDVKDMYKLQIDELLRRK